MKKPQPSKSEPPASAGGSKPGERKKQPKSKPSRELIHRFRGIYKGSGLLEELTEEKKREREL